MSTLVRPLPDMIGELPPSAQQLVRNFVEGLLAKQIIKPSIKQDAHQVDSIDHNQKNIIQSLQQNGNLNAGLISATTSITDDLAGSLGPAAPDELDYFNTSDLTWQRFIE